MAKCDSVQTLSRGQSRVVETMGRHWIARTLNPHTTMKCVSRIAGFHGEAIAASECGAKVLGRVESPIDRLCDQVEAVLRAINCSWI